MAYKTGVVRLYYYYQNIFCCLFNFLFKTFPYIFVGRVSKRYIVIHSLQYRCLIIILSEKRNMSIWINNIKNGLCIDKNPKCKTYKNVWNVKQRPLWIPSSINYVTYRKQHNLFRTIPFPTTWSLFPWQMSFLLFQPA